MVTDGAVVSAGVMGVEPPVAAVLVSVLLSAPPPQAVSRMASSENTRGYLTLYIMFLQIAYRVIRHVTPTGHYG
jgi:hypothetical protein